MDDSRNPADPGYAESLPEFDIPETDWNPELWFDQEYPRLADIEPEQIEWIWEPYIARGKVTLIDEHPGVGKSLLTVDIASRLSKGIPMPMNGTHCAPETSLFFAPEDDPGNTLRPRFDAAGADLEKIRVRSFRPEHGHIAIDNESTEPRVSHDRRNRRASEAQPRNDLQNGQTRRSSWRNKGRQCMADSSTDFARLADE